MVSCGLATNVAQPLCTPPGASRSGAPRHVLRSHPANAHVPYCTLCLGPFCGAKRYLAWPASASTSGGAAVSVGEPHVPWGPVTALKGREPLGGRRHMSRVLSDFGLCWRDLVAGRRDARNLPGKRGTPTLGCGHGTAASSPALHCTAPHSQHRAAAPPAAAAAAAAGPCCPSHYSNHHAHHAHHALRFLACSRPLLPLFPFPFPFLFLSTTQTHIPNKPQFFLQLLLLEASQRS